jgi:TatD DNase family protein
VSVHFYDAHNHLQDDRFRSAFIASQAESGTRDATDKGSPPPLRRAITREELVAEAARAGVTRMVVNGSCEEDWPMVAELAREFPQLLPSFGYHPWYLSERTSRWQSSLVEFLDADGGAVGEIGLDRWKAQMPYEGQEEAFVWQLCLAAARNLPVSIHCLQAWGRLHELLRDNPRPERGFLLHSYGGSMEMVDPLARLGAYFSFPGYYIHERKTRQREAFRQVPIDRLLIETDAPDQLPPDSHIRFPLRDHAGQAINHPANLPAIYDFVARERGMPLDDLSGQIEENFQRLFGE